MTGPIRILALARDHGPVRIHTAVVFIVIPVHGMKVRALVNHQYLHTSVLGPALPCAVIRNRAELPIAYVHQLFRLDDALSCMNMHTSAARMADSMRSVLGLFGALSGVPPGPYAP